MPAHNFFLTFYILPFVWFTGFHSLVFSHCPFPVFTLYNLHICLPSGLTSGFPRQGHCSQPCEIQTPGKRKTVQNLYKSGILTSVGEASILPIAGFRAETVSLAVSCLLSQLTLFPTLFSLNLLELLYICSGQEKV